MSIVEVLITLSTRSNENLLLCTLLLSIIATLRLLAVAITCRLAIYFLGFLRLHSKLRNGLITCRIWDLKI